MTLRHLVLTLAALPVVAPIAALAKGNTVTVGQSITSLELPWTALRAGDSVFVKAHVDIAATCEAIGNPDWPMLMQTDGSFAPTCTGGPVTCTELLQDSFWRDGTELRFVHDETGASFAVRLWSCGMALCGQGTVPPYAPAGSWSTVEIPYRDGSPLALGDLSQATSLTVENAGEDRLGPAILAVSPAAGKAPPTHPGLTVVVQDDVSGVAELTARLEPLGGGHPVDGHVLDAVLRCGSGEPGEAVDCVGDRPVLDRGWLNAASSDWSLAAPNGTYYVRSISGRDRAGRYVYWEPPELAQGSAASLSKYAVTLAAGAAVPSGVKPGWEAPAPSGDETLPTNPPTAVPTIPGDVPRANPVPDATTELPTEEELSPLASEPAEEGEETATHATRSRKAAASSMGCTTAASGGNLSALGLFLVLTALARRASTR